MEVTKKKAAELLNVSQKEIERRIKKGELEARKKSQSKYADWIITIPDVTASPEEAKLEEETKSEEETKPEEEPKFEEEAKLEEETKPEEEPKELVPRSKRLREHRKEQEGKSDKWWF